MRMPTTTPPGLASRTARVGIVGLGPSGLRLAEAFAAAGFPTFGYEAGLAAGTGSFHPPFPIAWTADPDSLRDGDVLILCVPVRRTAADGPDLANLNAAVEAIARRPRPGRLVVLTGSVPPGTVRTTIIPTLAVDGQAPGRDFLLAYSPDPEVATDEPVPRVVGGFDRASAEAAAALFGTIHPTIRRVSSPEAAEVCGLARAAIRSVHTAAANEFTRVCGRMGLDGEEILAAAGLDHPPCQLDQTAAHTAAALLTWGVRRYGASAHLLEAAMAIHAAVPALVTGMVADALNAVGKPVKGSRIAVPGVVPPGSPASAVVTGLREKGAVVTADAPLAPEYLAGQDAVLLIVPLPVATDTNALVTSGALVIDGCGATRTVTDDRETFPRA